MDKHNLVGVVTVTYNSANVIDDFMKSMLQQSHSNFILYIVDNASSDGTLALLQKYPDPRVAIIRNSDNAGVAEGNNIGIRAALRDGCALVLLINNDTVFDSDLLRWLRQGLRKHDCHMVVPKILFFDRPNKIWCAGGYFDWLRGTTAHYGFCKEDDGRFNEERKVNYSPTCCMLVERSVFEEIGIMDPNYFVYFDDTDFCLRANRAGKRLFYLPGGRLLHKVSSLVGHRSDFALRYVVRNHAYYVLKNFPSWSALYYLPICQLHIFARSLFAREKRKAFLLAEKAFWEGILLFYSPQRSTGELIAGATRGHANQNPQGTPNLAKEAD